jgi:hypothetical protein
MGTPDVTLHVDVVVDVDVDVDVHGISAIPCSP